MKGETVGQGVVPLRTILRNILNLIDSFEARYKEGLDSYDQEFQELKQFSENLKSDPGYLCKEGEKSVNRKKNRYKDILPFDYTRVILADYGDIPGSDYINANFIKGASGSSAYIACQGPLPHTVNEFWRMIVECEVQVIVMACNEQESGKHKCENYWVEEEGVEREFGQVTVWLKKSRQVCSDFLVRTMKIRYPNSKGESEERSVCQFHYSAWPDHGVPLKVRPLLDMVRLIRDCQTSETLPVLVHCSAGCGRTGTICAIDYVWGLLRLGKLTPDFSLFNLVRDMRRQRIAMVQTKDQYILVHRAVKELFEEQLKIIDSHPYANVDINGLPLEIRAELEEPVYETVQFTSAPPPPQKVSKEDEVDSCKRILAKPVPPPVPPCSETVTSGTSSSSVAVTKHEKEAENHQRHLEQEKIKLANCNNVGSAVTKAACTPSPSSVDSHLGESSSSSGSGESKDLPEKEVEDEKVMTQGKRSGKGTSPKSSLLRNPSIVKLKAFFEKSKDDKEKKSVPTLSRAKSDVSSSSRFYANLASTFSSRGGKSAAGRSKTNNNSPSSPSSSPPRKEERTREKTPVEKIKSKSSLLSKPNISVKRSKSLRIIRPSDELPTTPREHVHLISSTSICSDIPDSSKLVRTSISSSTSQSSTSTSHSQGGTTIKVSVQQMEMPKLQKPVSSSVKPESLKAITTSIQNARGKKPDIPSKPQILSKIPSSPTKGIYGTTRVKIEKTVDDSDIEASGYARLNGKVGKYDTVNPKILSSSAGTHLTRSQSHVWTPSKNQTPVRIFSDENLSQNNASTSPPRSRNESYRSENQSCDEPDGVKLIRKQSLPITKMFSSSSSSSPAPKAKQHSGLPNESLDITFNDQLQKPVTVTSHSSFLEARKRVPKTNPYTNYTPNSSSSGEKSNSSSLSKSSSSDKNGTTLLQFHFGENIPLLKTSDNAMRGNSSESSSNTGTPRNSLPGTPTQSIDVLYSTLSNNNSGNHLRSQSKPILKGSLSSTPSESDEKLELSRTTHSVSQVPNNITGPQKISSVRIAVGSRERRNSFRQAVWKEDQAPTATSIPVENDNKSEKIYITTTSSVPYFVKSSAMPTIHQNSTKAGNNPTTSSAMTSSVSAVSNSRVHRDYEPIWPENGSSSNPFKIGSTNAAMNSDSNHIKPLIPTSAPYFESSSSSSKTSQQSKVESRVQDRMAEIKVLLEELRAPSCVEESKQRSSNEMKHHSKDEFSQGSSRKTSDALAHSSASSSGTSLKHHRSLRAPSRPQYQPGFACFTFRKPSSFESLTDQLYAEELSASKASPGDSKPEGNRSKIEITIPDDAFRPHVERSGGSGQRLNDYVSLRACRSSSATRPNLENTSSGAKQHSALSNKDSCKVAPSTTTHKPLQKSDSTPIPPPRSKRTGSARRDQGDYINIPPQNPLHSSNGISSSSSSNHHQPLRNGSRSKTGGMGSRKNSSSDLEPITGDSFNHTNHFQSNGHGFPKLSSAIPLSNGNPNPPSSPKAIIRALGLVQAKAANVRSRFANWAENKERASAKRSNSSNYPSSALNPRQDRSVERGGFDKNHSMHPSSGPPQSIAGPSTSRKHQYL